MRGSSAHNPTEKWVLRRLMHFRTFCPVRRPASWVIVAALLVAAGCGGDGDDKGPTATVAQPGGTSTTEAKTPEQQVEAAYLKSWDVYTKAVRDLDPSGLEQTYAEDALETVRKEIERRTQEGRASKVDVEHDIYVQIVDSETALVRDQYLNHSVALDAQTGQPTESDPNQTILETYTVKLIEGTWKVVRIVRERS